MGWMMGPFMGPRRKGEASLMQGGRFISMDYSRSLGAFDTASSLVGAEGPNLGIQGGVRAEPVGDSEARPASGVA